MENPIVVNFKYEAKKDWSDFELRGVKSWLSDYLCDQWGEDELDADKYFGFVYNTVRGGAAYGMLNCASDDCILPGAPEVVMDTPVSHFLLTTNDLLLAVFYVGYSEKEVVVRMN